MSVPKPSNEAKRLAALRSYRVLDTAHEAIYDDIVHLASFICETPIAVITLIDAERQWFKARLGIDGEETPREHAFCSYTILGDEPLIVQDATLDERFARNPLVTGAPNIRFYAGSPLIDRDGNALGSLCVVDQKARDLKPEQHKALQALARQVIAQLEQRRVSAELADALDELKAIRALLPICSFCRGIRQDGGYWQSVETFIGSRTGSDFSHGICPDCYKKEFPDLYAKKYGSGVKAGK